MERVESDERLKDLNIWHRVIDPLKKYKVKDPTDQTTPGDSKLSTISFKSSSLKLVDNKRPNLASKIAQIFFMIVFFPVTVSLAAVVGIGICVNLSAFEKTLKTEKAAAAEAAAQALITPPLPIQPKVIPKELLKAAKNARNNAQDGAQKARAKAELAHSKWFFNGRREYKEYRKYTKLYNIAEQKAKYAALITGESLEDAIKEHKQFFIINLRRLFEKSKAAQAAATKAAQAAFVEFTKKVDIWLKAPKSDTTAETNLYIAGTLAIKAARAAAEASWKSTAKVSQVVNDMKNRLDQYIEDRKIAPAPAAAAAATATAATAATAATVIRRVTRSQTAAQKELDKIVGFF